MDIPLNAKVECIDGEAGESMCVIIDPTNDQVTHLVVKGKNIFDTDHLVPVNLILETGHDLIKLRCPLKDLENMEQFTETKFVPYADSGYAWPYSMSAIPEMLLYEQERIPLNELAIHRGDAVYASDGRVGRVDEFMVDPKTDSISHLIMREGHLWGQKDVTIPVSQIERLETDAVYLKITKKRIEELPVVPVKRGG